MLVKDDKKDKDEISRLVNIRPLMLSIVDLGANWGGQRHFPVLKSASVPDPAPAATPDPVPTPEPAPVPAPEPAPAPEPVPDPTPVPDPVPDPEPVDDGVVEELDRLAVDAELNALAAQAAAVAEVPEVPEAPAVPEVPAAPVEPAESTVSTKRLEDENRDLRIKLTKALADRQRMKVTMNVPTGVPIGNAVVETRAPVSPIDFNDHPVAKRLREEKTAGHAPQQ